MSESDLKTVSCPRQLQRIKWFIDSVFDKLRWKAIIIFIFSVLVHTVCWKALDTDFCQLHLHPIIRGSSV